MRDQDQDFDHDHARLRLIERKLRSAIDDLSDARLYYASDPSDRNYQLLSRARWRVAEAQEEKDEFLETASGDHWPPF
ncbi:MAG: hypothetical protein KIS66_00425 [Fimbriimonadaceae bacterium]|nr:hypothetical protein [Fimbriimonadaceae bacterium]